MNKIKEERLTQIMNISIQLKDPKFIKSLEIHSMGCIFIYQTSFYCVIIIPIPE